MSRAARFFLAQIGLTVICAMAAAAPAEAQARREFVGPGKCTDCHDHKDEKEWSEKRDGDGKGKQHLNALNQLADAKAEGYAKATGVADIYDPKSSCVRCHASVVRGSADFGISCESCHGGGKDYLKPHQEKGAYQAALGLGMKDVVKKPENWVKDCVTCHVLGANDAALVKAGHSSGADFDLAIKFQPVSSHWQTKYTGNQVAGLANPLRKTLVSAVAAAAPAPAAPAAPPVAPPAATAPTPAAPSTPAAPPVAAGVAKPAPAAPAAPPPARGAAPAPAPAAPPAPLALPPPVPTAPSPVIATVLDAPVSQSPASLVGALQGRVAQLLNDLLTRGVRTPVKLTAPATKTPYRGADAELLRLQEEVIGLALEALGTAPPAKTQPPPK